jgi:hypothetical protein
MTMTAAQITSAMLLTTVWLNAQTRTNVFHKIPKSFASHPMIMVVRQTQNISTNVQETVGVQKVNQIVCPPGYFTCPDYTCLPGLAQFPLCNPLPTCTSQTNLRGRCSDGVTCTENLELCPT